MPEARDRTVDGDDLEALHEASTRRFAALDARRAALDEVVAAFAALFASRAWRLGDRLVRAVGAAARLRRRGLPWRPRGLEAALEAYRGWRPEAWSAYPAALLAGGRGRPELERELAEMEADLARLRRWAERFEVAADELLSSRRWRLGELLVERLARPLLFRRRRDLPVADRLRASLAAARDAGRRAPLWRRRAVGGARTDSRGPGGRRRRPS